VGTIFGDIRLKFISPTVYSQKRDWKSLDPLQACRFKRVVPLHQLASVYVDWPDHYPGPQVQAVQKSSLRLELKMVVMGFECQSSEKNRQSGDVKRVCLRK
jgi:hypothetical protein